MKEIEMMDDVFNALEERFYKSFDYWYEKGYDTDMFVEKMNEDLKDELFDIRKMLLVLAEEKYDLLKPMEITRELED